MDLLPTRSWGCISLLTMLPLSLLLTSQNLLNQTPTDRNLFSVFHYRKIYSNQHLAHVACCQFSFTRFPLLQLPVLVLSPQLMITSLFPQEWSCKSCFTLISLHIIAVLEWGRWLQMWNHIKKMHSLQPMIRSSDPCVFFLRNRLKAIVQKEWCYLWSSLIRNWLNCTGQNRLSFKK